MNLRTLKKLSKRAAPLLPLMGDRREQYLAVRDDNYHGHSGFPRKNWDRSRCHPSYEGGHGNIVYVTRAGHKVVMREPWHPLKGTEMVGAMSGGEEPEWDEQATWSALVDLVTCHFTDWHPDHDGTPKLLRPMRTASEILAAAKDMIAETARAA